MGSQHIQVIIWIKHHMGRGEAIRSIQPISALVLYDRQLLDGTQSFPADRKLASTGVHGIVDSYFAAILARCRISTTDGTASEAFS
jgi:hypothetical protein